MTQEDLSAHFAAASQFISSAMLAPTSSVLVHCFEGKSRSATIIAQHLMAGCEAVASLLFVTKKLHNKGTYHDQY